MKPEHIIISCDIEANGYRRVTLRLAPEKRGGVFRFYTVKGGLQAHPELCPGSFWEIEGDISNDGRDNWIKIKSTRKLTGTERREHIRKINSIWTKFYQKESAVISKDEIA